MPSGLWKKFTDADGVRRAYPMLDDLVALRWYLFSGDGEALDGEREPGKLSTARGRVDGWLSAVIAHLEEGETVSPKQPSARDRELCRLLVEHRLAGSVVARIFGISRARVKQIADKYGVLLGVGRTEKAAHKREVVAAGYASGRPIADIANELHTTIGVVGQIAHTLGIKHKTTIERLAARIDNCACGRPAVYQRPLPECVACYGRRIYRENPIRRVKAKESARRQRLRLKENANVEV